MGSKKERTIPEGERVTTSVYITLEKLMLLPVERVNLR